MCSILRHFSRRSDFDSYQEILLYEIGRKYSVLGCDRKGFVGGRCGSILRSIHPLMEYFIGPVYGKLDQVGEVFELQFFFEVFTVGANGFDTEMETVGNLLSR
jgi:hypothetical protein